MAVRVLVFDYDGTLAESNAVKHGAYRALFPAGARHDRTIERALARRADGTRFDVLREIVRQDNATHAARVEEEVNRLAAAYDRIATEGAATCPERAGATRALRELALRFPLYLLSLTPEESLRRIVQHRGWLPYFRAVRGAPCRKDEEIRAFAANEGAACSETLMIGDSEEDRAAAFRVGAAFMFMNEEMTMDAVLKRVGLPPRVTEVRP